MDSGNWIKKVFRLKKLKKGALKTIKDSSSKNKANVSRGKSFRKGYKGLNGSLNIPIEEVAAIRIQTAFRAFKARKALRRLKGTLRLQKLTQRYPVQKQTKASLGLIHSWCNIQSQIRTRRLCMVTEGRVKQKKLENQQKLEAKLHGLEVEWSGGAETMDVILAKIYHREEAAVKRERAMAYAFSHQWRANCSQSQGLGSDELGKANWGWSWKERWIAARPWESRVAPKFVSPKKAQSKLVNKTVKTPVSIKTLGSVKTPVSIKTPGSVKTPISIKTPSPNGKGTVKATKARRLSFPSSEKNEQSPKVEETNVTKKEELVT